MENKDMSEYERDFIKFFNEEVEKIKKMSDEELEVHIYELKKLKLQTLARLSAARLKWR